MRKTFKLWIIPIIVILFILITISQILDLKNNDISLFNLITSFSLGLFFIVQLCYANYYELFKFIHKIKLYILNPAVDWNSKTRIDLDGPINFKKQNEKFYSNLLETNEFKIKRAENNENDFELKIGNSDLNIHYDYEEITIIYKSRLSYRDSLNEFSLLVEKLLDNYTSNIRVKSKKIYELDIKFNSYNPFYKLNIKHIEDHQIKSFHLKANIEPIDLEVFKNRMIIRSKDKNSILEASRDYFAL